MPACILYPAAASGAELLPTDAWAAVHDVLGPGPLLQAPAGRGCTLAWLSPHLHAEHNTHASRLAGQAIKGDACLYVADADANDLETLLQGHLPRRRRGGSVPLDAASAKRQHLSGPEAAAGTTSVAAAARLQAAAPAPAADAPVPPAADVPVLPAAAPVPPPLWGDLPSHVVAAVAMHTGSTAAAVAPLAGTCRAWREAVAGDDQLLMALDFRVDARAPFRGEHRLPPAALRGYLRATSRYPRLLVRAARLENRSAVLTMARLLEAADGASEAMRWWRRGAKLGDLEAQLRVGMAAYHGSCGAAQDPEAAAHWLGKALKRCEPQPPANRGGGAGGAASSEQAAAAAAAPVPEQLRLRVLREAGLVLGYLHFDGEGVTRDAAKSCALFKVAADAGCSEAASARGWMFNTGQY